MNPLSQAIHLLFAKRSAADVLNRYLYGGSKRKAADEDMDEGWWKQTFATTYHHFTLDHAGLYASQLEGLWMKAPQEQGELQYSARPTVFNALLHFTSPLLVERGNQFCCCYDGLLRWHCTTAPIGEDTFTCAYLAAKDLMAGYARQEYQWSAFLDHDNRTLNNILQRPKADIHLHLQGSSLNFDISWLSLMNDMRRRKAEFKNFPELYPLMYKAAAIRLYLFCTAVRNRSFPNNLLLKMLQATTDLEAQGAYKNLAASIGFMIQLSRKVNKDSIDYAVNFPVDDKKPMALFAGERNLLYACFRMIYAGAYGSGTLFPSMLYIYMLLKAEMRREILQVNDIQGFDNFNTYERRKELFVDKHPKYEGQIVPVVVSTAFSHRNPNDYLELRIAPKKKTAEAKAQLKRIGRPLKKVLTNSPNTLHGYVYHFIKRADTKKNTSLICRHQKLRNQVKRQALVINFLRCTRDGINLIKGIDAANSELLTRPEVFAQAFRFLREYSPHPISSEHQRSRLFPLGFTYHVGEDFYDLVDGLRAIDEVLHFMNFTSGDRLGHALALGVSVEDYYKSYENTIVMPAQVLFGNIVWLSVRAVNLPSYASVVQELDNLFYKYRTQIYDKKACDKYTFYQSWLLRGDVPKHDESPSKLTPWSHYDLNMDANVSEARKSNEANDLYEAYHYDKDVKKKGNMPVTFSPSAQLVKLIAELQEDMLCEVERKRIAIETNPTSNLRIGQLGEYRNHPIYRFNNDGIKTNHKPHYIPVSINTDDRGVFATSLERELSLVAAALEREGNNSPAQVYQWIDRIREMAVGQKF